MTSLTPVAWPLLAVYVLVLVFSAGLDLARLPGSGFSAERSIPSPLSLGATEQVHLVVRNPRAASLYVALADHAPLALRPRPLRLSGRFDPEGRVDLAYTTRPPRRGEYRFSDLDLRCWRRGGWWMRQVRVPLPASAAVYPDVLAVRRFQMTVRRGLKPLAGQRRARAPGASTAFSGLRDYLPGDDVRRISWKATARRDFPVTVEVEAERGQQVLIALECGRLMTAPAGHLNKHDHAVNAALLLAWVAQSQGDRVGLMTFSDRVMQFLPPQRGMGQVARLNEALYRVEAEYTEPDFGTAFAYLSRRLGRRSLVIVLTDVLDLDASRELVAHTVRLGRRHLVLVVAMSDPSVLAARERPIQSALRAYEWAAAEELLAARRQSFEALQRGGALGLDVPAGRLSPSLVERYLELKERALL
jgi:uncharacterized protein (DUF58 family)